MFIVVVVELGPVTTQVVRAVGETVERLKPRNPHKIAFEVLDRTGQPVFDARQDHVAQAQGPAKLGATEKAEIDELQRLRNALYADSDR
jgi:hypothetical protein